MQKDSAWCSGVGAGVQSYLGNRRAESGLCSEGGKVQREGAGVRVRDWDSIEVRGGPSVRSEL